MKKTRNIITRGLALSCACALAAALTGCSLTDKIFGTEPVSDKRGSSDNAVVFVLGNASNRYVPDLSMADSVTEKLANEGGAFAAVPVDGNPKLSVSKLYEIPQIDTSKVETAQK